MDWSRMRTLLGRHRTNIASWTVLSLAAASLVVYAAMAEGEKVHRAELNDAGVWVTKTSSGYIGRQNTDLDQLDAYVDGGQGSQADVLQDGAAVLAIEKTTLTPVSASLGAALTKEAIQVKGVPSIGGSTLAVVDAETGELRATRFDAATGVGSLSGVGDSAKALVRVGRDAAAVAAVDGTVLAVSSQKQQMTSVRTAGEGFAEPERQSLPDKIREGVVALTAVGDSAVLLDGSSRVLVPGGSDGVPEGAVLQQPGSAAEEVLAATPESLLAVRLEDGESRKVATVKGTPAAPVRVGSCAYGAWANGTTGYIVQACDGREVQGPAEFGLKSGAELKFRVNRGRVLLNDTRSGDVWRLQGAQATEVSDWQSVTPKEQSPSDSSKSEQEKVKQPPQASPDVLGAKPGRTTKLAVLDNDLVSGGGVLSIVKTTGFPKAPGLNLELAPDRQALLLTLPPGWSKRLSFGYTITDGTGGDKATADGTVEVSVKSPEDGGAPVKRHKWREPTSRPVAAGSTLEVSATDDWRDYDFGDPVSLDRIKPGSGYDATPTPDGRIRLHVSPDAVGPITVRYDVSTGKKPAEAELKFRVLNLDKGSDTTAPAVAVQDVSGGEVGSPIKIRPLDNDVPGADVTDPQARMFLAGRVAPNSGLQVDTDEETGVVTVRSSRPGVFHLKYSVGYGAAHLAGSTIRVVVDPAKPKSNLPIATPDSTTVRGTSPVLVDVLANDYDAKGRLLAVQQAEPVDPEGGLEVAVIDGRWLRIAATSTTLASVTQSVAYTVSNGDASARGSVLVTQKPALKSAENAPLPADDDVTVRVGDTVVVPVLENDVTPAGDPVGLVVPVTTKVRGELQVTPAVGHAYVVGRNIRYVAPSGTKVTHRDVEVQYVVENATDHNAPTSAGVLHVHLTPEPSADNPNHPPTPRALEGRVVQGDTVSLRLPLVGNDPDGDSVSIVGIGTGPSLGRVLAYGANTIRYQAFPSSAGTDEFRYVVTDRYGAQASGAVRVAVTPTGSPQAPVAVDDVITARSGGTVVVDVLANDLRTPGTRLLIRDLGGVKGVKLLSPTGPIRVEASSDTKRLVAVPYTITNGLDDSTGELVVRSVDGHNNPPVAFDAYPKLVEGAGSVKVDLLDDAYDIDGDQEDLELAFPLDPTLKATDGRVTIPVRELPQVVPFTVTDGDGGVTAAAAYVPAAPKGAPYLHLADPVQLKPGEKRALSLADITRDPEDQHVVLTLTKLITAAPSDLLQVRATKKNDELVLQAGRGTGPASVTFEVSDQADFTAKGAHRVVLTVPVQVGAPDPVINCPAEPITVVAGASSKLVDVASICHVWTADPAEVDDLKFSADWASGQRPGDVEVESTDAGIRVTAGIQAKAGARAALDVAARGSKATGRLSVRVVAAGPPQLRSMTLESKAGQAVSVDVAAYARSPFGAAARWKITSVGMVDVPPGGRLEQSVKGTRLTLTPSKYGVYTARVTLADDGGPKGSTRPTASALVTLAVVDKPATPTNVRWDGIKRDGEVRLTWTAPDAQGGRIDSYKVTVGGHTTVCPAPRCSIRVANSDKAYSFTVVAHNQYGDSKPSAPAPGEANKVPDAVVGLKATQARDHEVTLAWSPPLGSGTAPKQYWISWPGVGEPKSTTATTFTARGLTNGVGTRFSVWAQNTAGPSPFKATMTDMAAGRPATPSGIMAKPVDAAGRTQSLVQVTWAQQSPNGPEPLQFQVSRSPGGVVCPWSTSYKCEDTVGNDGAAYTYSVVARNGEALAKRETQPALHVSAPGTSGRVVAAAQPDTVVFESMLATGNDGQVKAVFRVGRANGAMNDIQCNPRCGSLSPAGVGRDGGTVTAVIGGFNNGSPTSIEVRSCNGSGEKDACSAWVPSPTTYPWGPIGSVTISAAKAGSYNPNVNWSISVNPNGNPVRVVVTRNGSTIFTDETGRGAYSYSRTDNVGYGTSGNYVLTVSEGGLEPGQADARANKTANASATTDSKPPPPTISNFNAVDGGCRCGGPFLPIQVGIAWDTTYQTPVPGAVCVMTMDGSILGDTGQCGYSGHASAQWGVPAGNHTFCGYIRLPDGRESNRQCESGYWDGR